MITLDPQTTVGEMLKDLPARSRVFEQFKIDYCCGGKIPLSEACAKRGVNLGQILRELERVEAHEDDPVDADAMGLAELADHIEQTHHTYLRQELPRLDFMSRKVAATHGENEPRLLQLHELFESFRDELVNHMAKEEQILFPLIRQVEQSDGPASFHCGSLAHPIARMEHEHKNAGDALAKFRELTGDYTPPDWACNTFRAMYDAFAGLESNMHQHVHKENNVLFPKALAREAALAGSRVSG